MINKSRLQRLLNTQKCPHCGSILFSLVWRPICQCDECGRRFKDSRRWYK